MEDNSWDARHNEHTAQWCSFAHHTRYKSRRQNGNQSTRLRGYKYMMNRRHHEQNITRKEHITAWVISYQTYKVEDWRRW
eukprot:4460501-Heterocapsa_arctica.AAC.1